MMLALRVSWEYVIIVLLIILIISGFGTTVGTGSTRKGISAVRAAHTEGTRSTSVVSTYTPKRICGERVDNIHQ